MCYNLSEFETFDFYFFNLPEKIDFSMNYSEWSYIFCKVNENKLMYNRSK